MINRRPTDDDFCRQPSKIQMSHFGPYSETTLDARVEFEFEILVNFTFKNATRNLSLSSSLSHNTAVSSATWWRRYSKTRIPQARTQNMLVGVTKIKSSVGLPRTALE